MDTPREVTLVVYADDLALIVTGKSAESISASVTNMMVEIQTWMEERGLEIAPQKNKGHSTGGTRYPQGSQLQEKIISSCFHYYGGHKPPH